MKRRLAVIGLGRLSKACGKAIAATEDLVVAGIVRRPDSLDQPLPAALRGGRVAPHASQPGSFDYLPASHFRSRAKRSVPCPYGS
jgi:diaminopimelate dehydrogenase